MSVNKISHRKLTDKEAGIFAEHIKQTPNIIGYLPHELIRLESVFIAEGENQTRGMLAYIAAGKYIDLKILFVMDEFRGQGIGSSLFAEFDRKFSDTQKPIYSVTRNKTVIEMLTKAGYTKTGFVKLPLACKIHQLKMILSIYRAKEYIRKLARFRGEDKFSYYIKLPGRSST